MSRYILLIILTAPFILASILSNVTRFKLGKITKQRFIVQMLWWTLVAAGLVFAEPMYEQLREAGLTQTDSLSLFDVVQITLIIFLLYAFNRMRLRLEVIERRARDLHQELSIELSKEAIPPRVNEHYQPRRQRR